MRIRKVFGVAKNLDGKIVTFINNKFTFIIVSKMALDINFENKGINIGKIPVEINYRIIELFSAGLYSSPNKAFEELVSNSYDADANKVSVYLSDDLNKTDSLIWVCDNGTGMDSEGLNMLWKIGKSCKISENYKNKRKPIGQFGIGKLATYVLCYKLTHICKKDDRFLAVTMNYRVVSDSASNDTIATRTIKLDERELKNEEEVKEILEPLVICNGQNMLNFDLWGENSSETWTIAIMSDLKEKGRTIKKGMLKWVLRTALPISPKFNLYFNGAKLEPSKYSGEIIKEWIIGKDDVIAKREDYGCKKEGDKYYVDLPTLKNIRGKITLYETSLVGGKSDKWGHSHGIFLMIRGRLINTDNALLNGMKELHHATFNRIRIEIHADDLSDKLTSTRESIKDSIEYEELIKYIKEKFFKAKAAFSTWCEEKYPSPNFADKISNISPFYSKVPIYNAIKKCFSKEVDCPTMVKLPDDLTEEEEEHILNEIDASITNPEIHLIEDYSLDNDLRVEDPIAKFNLKEKKIEINTHHPFYISFLSEVKGISNLPFTLIAANEIFTEASLIEKNLDQLNIRDIMHRRDEMLRSFSKQNKTDIFVAVMNLKNSLNDEKGLEEALHDCFECLGFDVEPMAKKGTAEGKAVAQLGIWNGKREDYSFTYEAKSTKGKKIKADTAKTGVVNLHRKKHQADYALEVAIDYYGAEKEDSNVNQLAENDNVTLVRAKDLWKLMINAIPNQLNFLKFKEFLSSCRTIIESSQWIDNFCKETVEKKPYKEILDTIWACMKEDPKQSPSLDGIRYQNKSLMEYDSEELRDIITMFKRMMPHLVNIENDKIRILLPPDKTWESLSKLIEQQAPSEFKEKFEGIIQNNLDKD